MAIAIVVAGGASELETHSTIRVTGSGFTHSGSVNLKFTSEEGDGGMEVFQAQIAADGSGNFDTNGVMDMRANKDGHVNVTATDVTAATSVSSRLKIVQVD